MTRTPNDMTETPKHELLADVLRRVRLSSAVFLRGEFSAPWAFASVPEVSLASLLAPDAKRLVLLHLAVEGSFEIRLEPEDPGLLVAQGEAVVLPYCDMHYMGYPAVVEPTSIMELIAPPLTELPLVARQERGGQPTRILCGYLDCDDLLFDPVLRALPRLIHVKAGAGKAAEWREASLRYFVEQLSAGGGKADVLARIPELVLVDCLQQYAETLRPERGGWLASLEDPVVGRALRAIHAAPAEDWTVDRLAKETGVSRSILAERFTAAIGLPPIRYVGQWRLQIAADLVRTTKLGVAEIAGRVGYESEAAFSRAFKRQYGVSPASWRETPA